MSRDIDISFDPAGIRAVVFDLDGTLYPGYATLEFYIGHVLEQSGHGDVRSRLVAETTDILEGRHPEIRLGTFVRGTPGTEEFSFLETVEDRDALDRSWTYLGDGWTVVYYLTQHHRIERDVYIDAFHASRFAMSRGALEHRPSVRWRDALEQLRQRGVHLVMQTNSSEDSGEPTLVYLGVDDCFDEYIYSAGKPGGMESLFARLQHERGIKPEEILSIGDDPWNDIVAARRLGGRTLLISPFPGLSAEGFHPRVFREDEVIDVLTRVAAGAVERVDGVDTAGRVDGVDGAGPVGAARSRNDGRAWPR